MINPITDGFKYPLTSVMEGIISFHDDLLVFLTLILFFVLYIFSICIYTFGFKNNSKIVTRIVHASTLEIIWTIIPAIILLIIAIPSFSLLYSIDEIVEPLYNIKVIGHQWYWSYELVESDSFVEILNKLVPQNKINAENTIEFPTTLFDSYLIPNDELMTKQDGFTPFRLLSVDNHLFIPAETSTRILISSADVLHSWCVPSLGIKVDACPGRLNQTSTYIKRGGVFYGQCSEICGVNHGFMPIGIYSYGVTFFVPTTLTHELFVVADPILSGLSSWFTK